MMSKPDILIVGGGILGLSIGTSLAESGVAVTLVSDDTPRASDASLVWLNVISAEHEAYAKLRVASMQLWAQTLKQDKFCPVETRGALLWDRDPDGLRALAEFQSNIGWPVEALDSARFAALAPGIGDVPLAALSAPLEAAADPKLIMAWALQNARSAGVKFAIGLVERVLTKGGHAKGVQLADGAQILSDGVILANGMGQSPLVEPFSVDAGLRDAPGMLVRTKPVPFISKSILASPLMDFWQDGDGRVLMATGTHKTMIDDLQGSARAALADLRALAPGAIDAKIETLDLRQRPIPGDGHPIVGPVPGVGALWMALTHSGMTLAPVIATSVRDMVAGNASAPELSPFSPDRLMER